jgi:PUA domain protein
MLSKRDGNHVIGEINRTWPNKPSFNPKNIRIVEIDDESSILIGQEFIAVKTGKKILPFLKMEVLLKKFGIVVVDKGAIKFVCSGANIMRPGVIRVDGEFKSGDIVAVEEEQYNKIISVGIALKDSLDINNLSKGVVVENFHHIGDSYWEAYKKVN